VAGCRVFSQTNVRRACRHRWAAALVGYGLRADFAKYSLFTVGVFERLTRAHSEADQACMECDSQLDGDGEVRTYYKEIVVAGMAVVRYDTGRSYYCHDHRSFELAHGEAGEQEATSRLPQSVVVGFARFTLWVFDAEEGVDINDDDSEFSDVTENVTSTASAVIGLVPVAILIVTASLVINAVNAIEGGDL